MAEIKLEGVDEIIARLNAINANVNKLTNTALKAGAEPMLEDAKATSSFNDRTGNLRAGLKISGIKTKDGVKYVLVGIDKSDNSKIFYGKFFEWGTSRMPARPFLGPAYERCKHKVLDIIRETLKEGLK